MTALGGLLPAHLGELDAAGGVTLHVNDAIDLYYLQAAPGYSAALMEQVLDDLERLHNLAPLDSDDEPELPLADGSVRIYLTRG